MESFNSEEQTTKQRFINTGDPNKQGDLTDTKALGGLTHLTETKTLASTDATDSIEESKTFP